MDNLKEMRIAIWPIINKDTTMKINFHFLYRIINPISLKIIMGLSEKIQTLHLLKILIAIFIIIIMVLILITPTHISYYLMMNNQKLF